MLSPCQPCFFKLSTFVQEETVAPWTTSMQLEHLVCHFSYPQLTGKKLQVEFYLKRMWGRRAESMHLKTHQLSTLQKFSSLMATMSWKLPCRAGARMNSGRWFCPPLLSSSQKLFRWSLTNLERKQRWIRGDDPFGFLMIKIRNYACKAKLTLLFQHHHYTHHLQHPNRC